MPAALSFQSVSKRYAPLRGGAPAFMALDEVSFDVAEGGILGLLGPNGAGKTTLISILAGLARASSGRALVLGVDAQREPLRQHAIAHIASDVFRAHDGLLPSHCPPLHRSMPARSRRDCTRAKPAAASSARTAGAWLWPCSSSSQPPGRRWARAGAARAMAWMMARMASSPSAPLVRARRGSCASAGRWASPSAM